MPVPVSRETKRATYVAMLQRWGATLNLTAKGSASGPALHELIDDCLCITPFLPCDLDRLIDLGSGQGFPAIPLAIETGVAVDLIEADRRKAAFLVTVMAALGLPGTVHPNRIAAAQLAPAQCVTARALAPTAALIQMARPFLAPAGCGLFLKGPTAAAEIAALRADPAYTVTLLPTSRPPSCLVKVSIHG